MSDTMIWKFVGLRFPADVAKDIRRAAVERDETLTDFVRNAALAELKRYREREQAEAS